MNKEAEKFFREGVFRYAETRATVDAYEQVAKTKIVEVARDRTARIRGNASKELAPGHNSGFAMGDDNGLVAWAYLPASVGGEKVVWEIGIWWAHPDDSSDVCVYMQCHQGPGWLKKTWAELPSRNRDGWECFNRGLALRLAFDDTVEDAFDRLFNEAAGQLKNR